MADGFSFTMFFEINITNNQLMNNVVDYTLQPNIVNGIYYPPTSNLYNSSGYAYTIYNVAPFTVPTSSIQLDNPNNMNSTQLSIYRYVYSVSSADLMSTKYPNLQYQIMDLLYLQNNLFSTYTSNFWNSTEAEITVTSLLDIVRNYCNLNGSMNNVLCSSIFLPFPSIKDGKNKTPFTQSPCTSPYSDCNKGWTAFCTKESNYQSSICQNFYNGSYSKSDDKNTLNFSARNVLETVCQKIYDNTADKTNLDETYMTFCGCYLPFSVYLEYQQKYNVLDESVGPIQCWYLPCIASSFPPDKLTSTTCPSSQISNCIQTAYVNISDTGGGNIEDTNITVNQTIQSCSAELGEDPSSYQDPSSDADVKRKAALETIRDTINKKRNERKKYKFSSVSTENAPTPPPFNWAKVVVFVTTVIGVALLIFFASKAFF